MEVIFAIPDDIARRINETSGDLSRRALESLALEEFKAGHITKPELRRLLGFGTRWKLDGFLKGHGVYDDITMEDVERDLADLKSLGF